MLKESTLLDIRPDAPPNRKQLANIRTHPSVALALSQKTLKLHGWVYDIEKGSIDALDGHAEAFVPPSTNREVHAT